MPEQCGTYSDPFRQYTSKQLNIELDEAEMIQSMSRFGRCIDNEPMEAFLGSIKIRSVFMKLNRRKNFVEI